MATHVAIKREERKLLISAGITDFDAKKHHVAINAMTFVSALMAREPNVFSRLSVY